MLSLKQEVAEATPVVEAVCLDDKSSLDSAISTITSTHAARYIHISAWAAVFLTVTSVSTVAYWYAATMSAGLVRSMVEDRMRAAAKKDFSSDSKSSGHRPLYALTAMFSCAFWAAAPFIAWHSANPFGPSVALFLIVGGDMLALAQFKAAPINAIIVTMPYSAVYLYFVVSTFGTTIFPTLATGLVLLVLTIGYVLVFGVLNQREITRANVERTQLIRQLEIARKAAVDASAAKSMFLANMSHEIRTPMNGVLGMAELLAQTGLDGRQRLYAETIQKSGGALLSIINDILDFSKIEAGRLELDPVDFDMRVAVEDVVSLMAPRAHEKQLEIVVRFQPDLNPYVVGDGGRIRQVITNLVSNAIKFTEKGYVLVSVTGSSDNGKAKLCIEVSDTGIGIAEDKVGKIFDSFQQADTSTTRKFGGTGLGLSISRRLIEAMDSELRVSSTEGSGSRFWFDLELSLCENPVGTAEEMPAFGSRRILIVDDIDVNRQISSEQLTAWGFSPETAESGADALAMLRDAHASGQPYELAILDFFMPEMDGEMLARAMREDKNTASVPILVLTSVDQPGDARRFREIGVEGYLVKPARSALLLRTIKEILTPAGAASVPEAVAAATMDEQPIPESEKIRVLLAEDNEVNQLVIRHMLNPKYHNLTIVNNGLEAVDSVRDNHTPFDVILMDVSMPVMDGYAATKEIRAMEREEGRPKTPIICLTAHVLAADVDNSVEAGMDDFLSKPISQDKLADAIGRWNRRGEDDLDDIEWA